MDENQNESTETIQPSLSVGAMLRAEREARGLSVEEIAERVKYSVRQVEALEHDDAEHLPQGTFLRGFVRSYAKVLGLEEAKLLEATHTQTDHHFDVADVQAGGAPLPIIGDANRRSRYLMLGALAVAILLAAFVLIHPEDISLPTPASVTEERAVEPVSAVSEATLIETAAEKPEVAPAVEQVELEKVAKPAPVSGPKQAEVKTPAPTIKTAELSKPAIVAKPVPVVKPAEPAKVVELAKPVVTPKPVVMNPPQTVGKTAPAQTEAPVSATIAAPSKPELPLAQLMKRPIHIVFVEDAWMEIIDVNGEILLSRVTKAGEEKWIGGGHRAPYNISIGRPGAVRMYYHGKEVDLSQFNPANVAKLVLE
ncbi:MAG: DUF4115 domain-containing protein [Sideroxydans sp.]|nr:DUF4115 domain-containing protein [Sideroxydans sp.]